MTSTRPSVSIDPTHRAAQTAEPVTEVRDEHFGASGLISAACVRGADLAQPPGVVKTKIISKHDLLDVEFDDDEIDTWKSIDPWEKYFISAQSNGHAKKLARSSDNSSSLSLNEIFEILKIEQRCKNPELSAALRKLVSIYQDRFAVNVESEPAAIPPFHIDIDSEKWSQLKPEKYPRPQTVARQQAVDKFVRKALADKIIRPSHANYFSQVLLTPKANGTWRFCIDYRRINELTKSLGWPIPHTENLLRRIGAKRAKYFATLDYTSGYYQAPIDENSKKYTAFITTDGIYEFNRVPMGPKGAPAYFQQQMQHTVFPDLIQSILEVYLDDIITWADTEENLIKNLEKIFIRLREKNISLNPEKCKLGLTEIEYVGHVINQDGLSFSKEKLDKVDNFRLPENHKNLKAFLGLASYFRDHVKNFASITRELQQIITPYKPRQRLVWTNELQTAFYAVQQAVVNCPKIFFANRVSNIFAN